LIAADGHRTVNVVRRKDAAAVVCEAGGGVVLVDGEDLAKRVTEVTDGAEVRLGIDAVAGTATGRMAGCLCFGSPAFRAGCPAAP